MSSETQCRVGSVPFEISTLDQAVTHTIDLALNHERAHLHFANAWSIALADDDDDLRSAFNSGRNFPDGKPVVWAMRWLAAQQNSHAPRQIDGPSFFEATLQRGVAAGLRHYFFGSTPETLSDLIASAQLRFPGLNVAGSSSPPFGEWTSQDYDHELAQISAADPHIVWVGLGTPKQDKVAAYFAARHTAVFACVGAAFDYTAGNLKAAPRWVQEAGLAWLARWIQEPRRLWRRYTYGNMKFVSLVVTQLGRQHQSDNNYDGG